MILVDTSVWIDHFRKGNPQLEKLLNDGDVICHPMIVGELACGNIKNRNEILGLLQSLPSVQQVEQDEILPLIRLLHVFLPILKTSLSGIERYSSNIEITS